MADLKISALPASTVPLAGTETLPIVQSGSTKQVSVSNLTAGRDMLASKIGLGTTPAYPVHVYDAATARMALQSEATGSAEIRFASPTVGYQGYIGYSQVTNEMVFATNGGVTGLSLDSAQNVKINTGNLIQGTAAKGVNFTANTPAAGMTSQLLNWYEEGTFTPVFTALTVVNGSGGATYSGRYTRVGRTVNFQVIIAVTGSCTTEAANGATRFTTPFTIAQDSTAGFTFLRAASIGVGTCDSVTNFVWCPAWAATNNNVIISGSYEV